MCASDLGYAARFQAFFAASSWLRQSGVVSSHLSAGNVRQLTIVQPFKEVLS
jgi:hypothetical protein